MPCISKARTQIINAADQKIRRDRRFLEADCIRLLTSTWSDGVRSDNLDVHIEEDQ